MASGTSGAKCVVRFMSASVVMCVGWNVSCEGRWYVCVGVRALQAQTIRGAHSQPLPPIDPDSSSRCHTQSTHWVLEGQEVPCWLLKIDLSLWKNAEEGQRDGRPSGRA